MKSNYAHVSILLDRSGSMINIKESTIAGFNKFIKDQKKVPGEMTLSVAQFDDFDKYDDLYKFTMINEVKSLTDKTFVPRGSTALLDSLAKMINETGWKLASMKEDDRPEKVVVLVLTDGEENDSREYTPEKIKAMIEHQEKKYNWQFMYIGANQDSFTIAKNLGMSGVNYKATTRGTNAMYNSVSATLASFRSTPGISTFNIKQEDIDNEETLLMTNTKTDK
jgi:hypothetical protein